MSTPPNSGSEPTAAEPQEVPDLSADTQDPTQYPGSQDIENDTDSAYGIEDDRISDTTSMSSSVSRYRYENGRRYHGYKDGLYMQPNDEKQLCVQDLGHHMMLLLLDNRLHLAPIVEKPQKIIDIGTGTGIWAIDMADQHESAEVIGTDLSPVQPSFVPANCRFEIDDASQMWTFTPSSADLVYFRFMIGAFSDWPSVYSEAFKTIKPGGWMEHHEVGPDLFSDDGTVTPNSPFARWGALVTSAGEKLGKTYMTAYNTKKWMEEAGFLNVVQQTHKLPVGRWPADPRMKEMGMWFRAYYGDGIEGYALALLTRVLGWEYLESQVYFGQLRAAIQDKSLHAYCIVTCVYGQKPKSDDETTAASP